MTSCQYPVDEHECGFAARVRVVSANFANSGEDARGLAVCTLHASDMFPVVAWEPIR